MSSVHEPEQHAILGQVSAIIQRLEETKKLVNEEKEILIPQLEGVKGMGEELQRMLKDLFLERTWAIPNIGPDENK